jgi:hypothetical protein
MLLPIVFLTATMTLQDLPKDVLESFYWDCDTMFMKGELGGQDMWTCLQITEEFQKTFTSKEQFKEYWNQRKLKEWQQRGYRN